MSLLSYACLMSPQNTFPILSFVTEKAAKMDRGLVRHFVTKTLMHVAPPFSATFQKSIGDLLLTTEVMAAVSASREASAAVLKFCDGAEKKLARQIRRALD